MRRTLGLITSAGWLAACGAPVKATSDTVTRDTATGDTASADSNPGDTASQPSTDDAPDADADGYGAGRGDCDDTDPTVHQGQTEVCGNGKDDDCNREAYGCGARGPQTPMEGDVILPAEYVNSVAGNCGDLTGDGWPDWVAEIGEREGFRASAVIVDGTGRGLFTRVSDAGPQVIDGGLPFELRAVTCPGDLDGDGAADLVIGRTGDLEPTRTPDIYALPGPFLPLSSLDDASLHWRSTSPFWLRLDGLLAAGDVDGDGTGDLWAATSALTPALEAHEVVWLLGKDGGRTGGFDDAPLSISLPGNAGSTGLGQDYPVAAGGDLDADGTPDLALLGNREAMDVVLFSGTRRGDLTANDADARITLKAPDVPSPDAATVQWLGDVTGDGYDDLACGDPDDATFGPSSGTPSGVVRVFAGPFAGTSEGTAASLVLYGDGEDLVGMGREVVSVGPLYGGGPDVLLVGSNHRVVGVDLPSGATGGTIALTEDLLPNIRGGYHTNIGHRLADAGDLNGDGLRDFILGDWEDYDRSTGYATLHLSGPGM